jgi:hypothetical protein
VDNGLVHAGLISCAWHGGWFLFIIQPYFYVFPPSSLAGHGVQFCSFSRGRATLRCHFWPLTVKGTNGYADTLRPVLQVVILAAFLLHFGSITKVQQTLVNFVSNNIKISQKQWQQLGFVMVFSHVHTLQHTSSYIIFTEIHRHNTKSDSST